FPRGPLLSLREPPPGVGSRIPPAEGVPARAGRGDRTPMKGPIAVIGGGGWGTALAVTMARVHERVRLWVFEPDLAETIRRERVNPVYLPGIHVPDRVEPAHSMEA